VVLVVIDGYKFASRQKAQRAADAAHRKAGILSNARY
jgi:hypothetical protein